MDTGVHPAPFHISVYCNLCQVNPIRGIRFKCTTCRTYNLCLNCFQYDFVHDEAHHFDALKKCTLVQNPKSGTIPVKNTTKQTNSKSTSTTKNIQIPYFGTESNPPTTNCNNFNFLNNANNNKIQSNNNESKPKPAFTFGNNSNSFGSASGSNISGNLMLTSSESSLTQNKTAKSQPFVYNPTTSFNNNNNNNNNNNFGGTGNFTANTFSFGNNGFQFTPSNSYSFGMTSTSFSSANGGNMSTNSMEMIDGSF